MKMYRVIETTKGVEVEKTMTESEFKEGSKYDVLESWDAYDEFVEAINKKENENNNNNIDIPDTID